MNEHFQRGRAASEDLALVEAEAQERVEAEEQKRDEAAADGDNDNDKVEIDEDVKAQTALEAMSDSQRTGSGALVQLTSDEVVGHRPAVVASSASAV